MKVLLLKFYLFVIVTLQKLLLAISKLAMTAYKPLPDIALKLRLALQEHKNESII